MRYEDRESCPTEFCIGFTMESMHLQSCTKKHDNDPNYAKCGEIFQKTYSSQKDDSGPAIFADSQISDSGGPNICFKMVKIHQMSVYWNPLVTASRDPVTTIMSERSTRDIEKFMSQTIAKRQHAYVEMGSERGAPKHHYILCPIDVTTYIDFAMDISHPTDKFKVLCCHICCH